MDDDRVWEFERSLWTGDADRYHELIADTCIMVVPTEPFVLTGPDAADAVSRTPRWADVAFDQQQVVRPQEGLIVIGYSATATRDDQVYNAYCSTTLRRVEHDVWRVVQHQQTPPPSLGGGA
jgi:hypothetical protein